MRSIATPRSALAILALGGCAPYATIEGPATTRSLPPSTTRSAVQDSQHVAASYHISDFELEIKIQSALICRTTTTPVFVSERTITTFETAPLPNAPLLSTIEIGMGAIGLAAGVIFTLSPESCTFQDERGRARSDPDLCRRIGIGAALGGAGLALLGLYEQKRGGSRLQTSSKQNGPVSTSDSNCHESPLRWTKATIGPARMAIDALTDERGAIAIDLRLLPRNWLSERVAIEINGHKTAIEPSGRELAAIKDRLIRTEGTLAYREALDSCTSAVATARAAVRTLSIDTIHGTTSAWAEAQEICGFHWSPQLDAERQTATRTTQKVATTALRKHLKSGDLRASWLMLDTFQILARSGTSIEQRLLSGIINDIVTEWSLGQVPTEEARARLCLCHQLLAALFDPIGKQGEEWNRSAVPQILRISEILDDPRRADALRSPCGPG